MAPAGRGAGKGWPSLILLQPPESWVLLSYDITPQPRAHQAMLSALASASLGHSRPRRLGGLRGQRLPASGGAARLQAGPRGRAGGLQGEWAGHKGASSPGGWARACALRSCGGGLRTYGLGAWDTKQCLEKGVSDRWDAHATPSAFRQLGQPGPAAASPAPMPLRDLDLSAAHLNSPREDASRNSTPRRLEGWRSFMSHESALTVLSQLTETMSSRPQ